MYFIFHVVPFYCEPRVFSTDLIALTCAIDTMKSNLIQLISNNITYPYHIEIIFILQSKARKGAKKAKTVSTLMSILVVFLY